MERREHNELDDLDLDLELSSDAEAQGANGSALATAKLSSKKKEALSQVPCKFFRSNGCSAGSSCPFAHIVPGEGQGKAVCQWFLKGSCRFGHKCALAHILPGQPMSMDRKNKRAAHHQQQNQNQSTNGQGHQMNQQRPTHDQRQLYNRPSLHSSSSGQGFDPANNLMFAGHTGPEEAGLASRNFMPAFANQHREVDLLFGVPDDLHATSMSQGSTIPAPSQSIIGSYRPEWRSRLSQQQGDELESFIRPSRESGFEGITRTTSVGSPISTQAFGTSPFSHPGSHSVFYSADSTGRQLEGERSMTTEDTAKARNLWQSSEIGNGVAQTGNDVNEEDFLPSSLSDLLTPAELQRRSKVGLNSSHAITPQSLPARTASSSSPWHTQPWQMQPQSGTSRDGDGGSLVEARDKLARDRAVAVSNTLPSPSYLQSDSSNPSLGVSNTSAGFLTSRLRSGLNSGQMDSEIDGTKSGPLDSYSPGAHAALSHAPGQSLPQGLAAGLSSLHLRSDTRTGARLQSDSHPTSSNSIWNQGNGTMMGLYAKANDELGPTAPSSIFGQKTPLHFSMARSMGGASASTSFGNHSTHLSMSNGAGGGGGGNVFSPYARSPAHRNEDGIAIPSLSEPSSMTGNVGNMNTINNKSLVNHPGKNRIRNIGASAASPLALPSTGEEVEEPIFELE